MNETRSGPTFFRKPAQTLNVNLGNADLASFQQKKISVKNSLWLKHLPLLILHMLIREIFFGGIFFIPKPVLATIRSPKNINIEGKNGFDLNAEERAALSD